MSHAPLAPSSSPRVVPCPGSVRMEAGRPDDDTEAAREGTASHWAAAQILTGHAVAVGQVADNGTVLNDEMIDGAEMYSAHIMARGSVGYVEQTVRPYRPSVVHLDNWGTPDHYWFDMANMTLYIDDYKYGFKFVDVWMNWQLINYALLILAHFGLLERYELRVVMTICQPRSYRKGSFIRTWETTVAELLPHFSALRTAQDLAMSDNAPCIASDPDACDDCKGRHECEAVTAAGFWGAHKSYKSTPLVMSPEAQSRELRELRRAEKFIKAKREGIEQAITAQIKRGQAVPYFALQSKPGRRVWKINAIDTGLIDAAYALEVPIEKPDLITPLQAIKAGLPEALVDVYSEVKSGLELVEDDGTAAQRIFGG